MRSSTVVICLLAVSIVAQEALSQESDCSEQPVESVPSRPTVSNGTDTTRCGVLEAEAGGDRAWTAPGVRRETVAFGLRMGLARNLDLHWQGGTYVNIVDSDGGSRGGFGENWIGVKYRFFEQKEILPSLGVFYSLKIPTIDHSDEFNSGRFDHSLSLLISRDIHNVHCDFNINPFLAGRHGSPGHDYTTGLALSCSVPVRWRFSVVAEGYGSTFLNPENPAYASTMVGLTYQVKPRLVLDVGSDWGVTHSAPEQRVYGGITIAMTNIYSLLRPPR